MRTTTEKSHLKRKWNINEYWEIYLTTNLKLGKHEGDNHTGKHKKNTSVKNMNMQANVKSQ